MPFFERRRDRVERERLELYARELERLYESAVEEKSRLERLLKEAREKALRLVEEYAPLSYKSNMGLLEALKVIERRLEELERENAQLSAELERLREEINIAQRAPEEREGLEDEPVRVGLGLESVLRVGREQALRRWEGLSEFEREVFFRILVGNCREEFLGRRELKAKSALVEKGLVRVVKVRRLSGRMAVFEVFFPSPLGVKVCELVEVSKEVGGVNPWTFLQHTFVRKKGFTMSHGELVDAVVEKFRHSNYEFTLDERELLVPSTDHRADVLVFRPVEVYVECETLANSLEQTFKMLDAYLKAGREYCIVVASPEAERMMMQRLCFYAWETGRSLYFKIATLRDLPNMSSYVILR